MKTDQFNVPRGFWLVSMLVVTGFTASDGLRLSSPGLLISALGLTLIGISLFIRPPTFFLSLAAAAKANADCPHKHAKLSMILTFTGLALLAIGGVLRFAIELSGLWPIGAFQETQPK